MNNAIAANFMRFGEGADDEGGVIAAKVIWKQK